MTGAQNVEGSRRTNLVIGSVVPNYFRIPIDCHENSSQILSRTVMNPSSPGTFRRSLAVFAISLLLIPFTAGAMQIQVELPGGDMLDLTVEPTDTVASVKEQIESAAGPLQIFQTLLHDSVELEDASLLSEYAIEEGDILTLFVDDPLDLGVDFTALIAIANQLHHLSNDFFAFQKNLSRNGSIREYRRGVARITRRLDTITDQLALLGLPKSATVAYRRSVLEVLRQLRPAAPTKRPQRTLPARLPSPPRIPFLAIN